MENSGEFGSVYLRILRFQSWHVGNRQPWMDRRLFCKWRCQQCILVALNFVHCRKQTYYPLDSFICSVIHSAAKNEWTEFE